MAKRTTDTLYPNVVPPVPGQDPLQQQTAEVEEEKSDEDSDSEENTFSNRNG